MSTTEYRKKFMYAFCHHIILQNIYHSFYTLDIPILSLFPSFSLPDMLCDHTGHLEEWDSIWGDDWTHNLNWFSTYLLSRKANDRISVCSSLFHLIRGHP